MTPRTIILSDTHLALPHSPVRSPEQLRPLWQGAHRLIINGDAAETRHPKYRAQAWAAVEKVRAMCDEDGVASTFIAGNHDPNISDQLCQFLAGRHVFVSHGHVFHPSLTPWNMQGPLLRDLRDEALAKYRMQEELAPLEARLYAAHEAAARGWESPRQCRLKGLGSYLIRPYTVARILHYWWTIPGRVARFMARHAPEVRIIVFGHSHRHGIWREDGRIIINTGSYSFPAKPWAVVMEGAGLEVRPIVKRREGYELGRKRIERFDLPTQTASEGKIAHAFGTLGSMPMS